MSGEAQDITLQRRRVLERGDLLVRPRREWTLVDLLSIFRRRRRILIGCVATMTAIAAIYCLLVTPRYMATAQIEVQKDTLGTLGLDHTVTSGAMNADADALDTSMTLETEAGILQSNTLALTVVKSLNLEPTEDYYPAHKNGFQIPAWLFFWKKPVEPLSVPLDDAPNRRFVVLKVFASHLKVEPAAGTRLIDVSYSSPDPRLASAVVNKLIEALQEYTFQSRFQASAQASDWLASQLAGLKKQTEDLQQTANRLEEGTGIYGSNSSRNLVLSRLEDLNGALSAAESNRILKEAIYQVSKSGDADLISGLAGNTAAGASPAMTNSLALLQTLRAQEASVEAEIDEDDARYGSAYPKVTELRAELAGVQKSIRQEITRIGSRAHTDYEIAARAEDSARDSFEQQKKIAKESNDRTVAYELARQEADGSRDLYQGLLGRLKEAGVLDGLRATNLTIVNAAMVPATNHPHSPNAPLCFVAAMVGGLFLGCGGALLGEAIDTSVRSVDELERHLGVSLAGVVPRFGRPRRSNRTARDGAAFGDEPSILRRSLSLPLRGASSQTILITSAAPGDGKSWLAASLAVSLAQSGARVLLVDADLLSPSLHTLFGMETLHAQRVTRGLAETLITGAEADILPCARVPGLSLVWAGHTGLPHSLSLLTSPRMDALMEQWRVRYDFVVLDSAPVLAIPDSATLARFCDRTLLIVRYESTTTQAAQRSYRIIQSHLPEHAALDVVMNGVPENSADYFSYYGFKGSGYDRQARNHA